MKISLKSVVAIVLAGAAAFTAVSASADVIAPSTGNGELTLFVRDLTTGNVYARGLEVTLDDIAPQSVTGGAYSGPTSVGFTLPTITHDANMTAFLATTAGHQVQWGVLGADMVGGNQAGTPKRVAFTTNDDILGNNIIPGNLQVAGAAGTIGSLIDGINQNLPDAAGSSLSGVDNIGGQWGNPGTLGDGADHVFAINDNNAADIGSAQAFYLATSTTGGNGVQGRLFQTASLQLDANGDLHAVAPVPLPAALWLFGSGLVGLAGIGRRRRQGATGTAA
ncbi:MAG TPA: VPLPA-CTERM sorting domain-containing protein [Steroidobacteraceae bacterium]|jgi:hypothetical protein